MSLESKRERARYNSLQEFIGFFKENENHPSTTNLFSVHFASPPALKAVSRTQLFTAETGDLSLLLDYYAKTVNLPSKQITTGQLTNVGSGYKFATGTSFSQISITFTMPRSQLTRNFFEKWTQVMASDANQYTAFYRDYCCPDIYIYKWERGGGEYATSDPKMLRAIREAGSNALLARKNELTACWHIQNAFPYNIGSVQLDNSQSRLMELNVQFYYERYRFYPQSSFDDPGIIDQITFPQTEIYTVDNNTDQTTARQTTVQQTTAPNKTATATSSRPLGHDIGINQRGTIISSAQQ